jgi:hypothetical protein
VPALLNHTVAELFCARLPPTTRTSADEPITNADFAVSNAAMSPTNTGPLNLTLGAKTPVTPFAAK